MKGRDLVYLFIFAVAVAVVIAQATSKPPKPKAFVRPAAVPVAGFQNLKTEERELYSIDNLQKTKGPAAAASGAAAPNVATLHEAYARYPKREMGQNLAAAWAKVKPADKQKFFVEVEKKAETAREILAKDPGNRKAKGALFIAENLKKLAKNNFDYSLAVSALKASDDTSRQANP